MNAAQRGLVVQRVIVDGWTIAAAAAAADLPEHLIAAWVADFRERGMASLRRQSTKTVAAANLRRRFLRAAGLALRAVPNGVRWLLALEQQPPASAIRQARDDRRGGS